MEVYRQMLLATLTIQESDGQMLGSDANMANSLTNGMVANSQQWSNEGPLASQQSQDAPGCGGELPYNQTDPNNNWISMNPIDGYNFGMPLSNKNYSNAQIEAQITYVANAVASLQLDGNNLSYAQIANQAWTAESQAMSARTQVQQTSLKTPTDLYNSQLSQDQQAQQGAVSALSNPLGSLMSSLANTISQGIM